MPAAAPEPEYDNDGFDEEEDYEGAYTPRRESPLANPYVLAAIAVFGAVMLAVVVVIMAGGGGRGGGDSLGVVPTRNPLTQVPGAATVDAISTSTVREGPGLEFDPLGTLSRGAKVQVTGRDEDSRWFQIVFPQNSSSRGWVPSTALKVSDINLNALAVVESTPISRPTPAPTSTPAPQATEVVTATPETTATPSGPAPDLNVSFLGACVAGNDVAVLVRNLSDTPVVGRSLAVSVTAGNQSQSSSVSLSLTPGDVVSIPTNMKFAAPQTTVTIELQGSPADSDLSDNSVSCVPSGGGGGGNVVTPTPVVTTPAGPTPTNTPPVAIPPAP